MSADARGHRQELPESTQGGLSTRAKSDQAHATPTPYLKSEAWTAEAMDELGGREPQRDPTGP